MIYPFRMTEKRDMLVKDKLYIINLAQIKQNRPKHVDYITLQLSHIIFKLLLWKICVITQNRRH